MCTCLGKVVTVIEAGVKVHPHQLRHTFAISFLRAGGDVFSLQYMLGHSTLAMTQRYLQSLDAGDAFKAHQRFSPLDNISGSL
jgi:integrase/recombinase XerD